MEAVTYSNAKVVEFSKKNFINVELSIDNDPPEARDFGVTGIPVTFLVSPEGKAVGQWLGFVAPDPYTANLEKAVAAHKRLKALEPKLAAAQGDPTLQAEAGALYADLGSHQASYDAFKLAGDASTAPADKAKYFSKALDAAFNIDGGDDKVKDLVGRLETLDTDGKLGVADNAAVAKGVLATRRQDFEAAIKHFEKAVTTWPKGDKSPLALFWLGYLYHEIQKDHEKGIKTLQRILKEFPKSDVAADVPGFIEHIKEHSGR